MRRARSGSVLALVVSGLAALAFVPPQANAQKLPPGAKTPLPVQTTPTPAATPVAPPAQTNVVNVPGAPPIGTAGPVPTPLPTVQLPTHWTFESALVGDWTTAGVAAAESLRKCGTTSRRNRPVPQDTLSALGGNYWDTPFPVGRGCVLDTTSVTSAVTISTPVIEARKMVSLVVGGGVGGGASVTRVELRDATTNRVIATAPAPGNGLFARVVWDLARLGVAAGTKLRIAIIDGHTTVGSPGVIVDDVMAGDTVETGIPKTPLWGFVDLHTHLFNQMGNGGRLFAGKIHSCVGQSRVECNTTSNIQASLGDCQYQHGNDTGFPMGTGQGVTTLVTEQGHNRAGFPTFKGWPRRGTTSHQQMYVDWIKRAWRGGLRLAHMDVLNNHALAWAHDYTGGIRINGRELLGGNRLPNSTDDDEQIKMQIQAAKDFVKLPDVSGWMDIAYSPEDARRIIQAGKLALVLGIEVDDMGGFNRHPTKNLWAVSARAQSGDVTAQNEIRTKVAQYLDWLQGLGVRHIFPVHVFDSPFGGAAISEFLPDLGNAVFQRFYLGNGQFGDAGVASGRFMQVRNTTAADQIFLRLDHEYKDLKELIDLANGVSDVLKALGVNTVLQTELKNKFSPLVNQRYAETRGITFGAANAKGLSKAGAILVDEMMKRALVIDVSHSSEYTTNAVIAQAKAARYPIMAGHTGLRDTSFGRYKGTTNALGYFVGPASDNTEAFDSSDNPVAKAKRKAVGIDSPGHQLANERSLSLKQIRDIRDLGGMVGLGTGESSTPWLSQRNRCDSGDCRVAPDCDGTSKSFLNTYLYLLKEMNGRGVGLGTDFNGFVSGMSGRFGGQACSANSGDQIRYAFVNEQARAQKTPVRYTGVNNGLFWMDRSRFEGLGTLTNLDPPPSGIVNEFVHMIGAEVFKETMREWRPSRVIVVEDEMAIWEGLWRAKRNDPSVSGGKPYGCDTGSRGYDRDMRRYGWGFWLAFNGGGRPGSDCFAGTDTNADSNAAWDTVKGSASSQNADVFARVKRIYEKWNLMTSSTGNPPLEKLTVTGGGITRDFDFNVDGFANYGLLPDMMQDLRNALGNGGNDRAASEDLAPLFLGANDYVVMWDDIVAKAAGMQPPRLTAPAQIDRPKIDAPTLPFKK